MTLLLVGTDHHHTSLAVRERLAVAEDQTPALLRRIHSDPAVDEVVVLSTCNRTEVYMVTDDTARATAAVLAALPDSCTADMECVRASLAAQHDQAAAQHLCAVAAGIESLVVAETQILGQVRDASEMADRAETNGPILRALFRDAQACGKQVRTTTDLGRVNTSVASVVIEHARATLPNLAQSRVVLVGAGKMNALAAALLQQTGVSDLWIASRTPSAAENLAKQVTGASASLDSLPDMLRTADIVISATRSPQPIIGCAMVADALPHRHADLHIYDIAVPRDVEPAVANLPRVFVHNIDGLPQTYTSVDGLAETDAIVATAAQDYMAWLRARSATPLIASLRAHVDQQKDAELSRTLAHLAHLTEADQQEVAQMAHRLINKMFHHLAVQMKRAAADPTLDDYLAVARYLFTPPSSAE